MRALMTVAAAIAVVSGCTLINGGFSECEQDTDCTPDRVCARRPAGGGYCVKPGCNEQYGSTKENAIKLGAALPITIPTPTSDGGIAYVPDESEIAGLNAIKLAVDEVNENGGVGRREFSLVVCDTTGDGTVLAEQISFLSGQGVPAVITSGSSQTIAAANAAASVTPKMLVMTGTGTSPSLSSLIQGDGKDLVWRTAPSDELQASVMSRLIKTDTAKFPGVTKVAIVYVDDAYGQGLAEKLQAKLGAAPNAKTTVSFQLERSASNADIISVADQLNTADPELTIVVLFAADANRFITEAQNRANLRRVNGHNWFFADAAKDPNLISSGIAPAVNGSFGTAPAQGAGAAFTSFATRFQTRHGVGSATAYSFTAHNYDAFYVLALASASAVGSNGAGDLTGATISTGLGKLSTGTQYQLSPTNFTAAKTALEGGATVDVEGASGALQFDANGEAPSLIELWKIDTSATPPIVKVSDEDPSL